MSDVKPRVRVPKTAAPGETVTLKTLISHAMESGQRKDRDGNLIPRQILNHFVCTFNGETVIDVAMEPAISSNPYFEFEAKVPESGTFTFVWTDDDGTVYETSEDITVG